MVSAYRLREDLLPLRREARRDVSGKRVRSRFMFGTQGNTVEYNSPHPAELGALGATSMRQAVAVVTLSFFLF